MIHYSIELQYRNLFKCMYKFDISSIKWLDFNLDVSLEIEVLCIRKCYNSYTAA